MASIFLLCSAVAVSAQSTPSPAPTSSPQAELPEIGRIRAVSPVCAVMRDFIIPAWKTSQQVDTRFDRTVAPRLPQYIKALDEDPTNPLRPMNISYLDQQASLMKQSLESIDAALNNYRLRNARDPQIAGLRDKLQDLYDAQSARANILWEFVTRERIKLARHEFATLRSEANGTQLASPTPDPAATPVPYAMPPLTGISIQDERTMSGWGRSLTAAVRQTESATAGTFAVVAASCT